jgi:site-specific recombinase XerC
MYAMASYLESIRRTPRSLTDREQAALLRVTGERFAGYRDHLLFSMALGTGLRAHELLALNVGDVLDDLANPRRRVMLRVFKGHASNRDTQQDALLSNTLRLKLQKFHAWKVAQHQSVEATAPLFVSQRRQRLSLRQLRHSFAKWQQRAGFERHLSFHSLRHAACGAVYARSRDLRLTQRFARHRSVVTTMVYTHPSDEELVRAVEQLRC